MYVRIVRPGAADRESEPWPIEMPASLPLLPLDLDLVRGFRFACRPDCGLCCFAEPRVAPEELVRITTARPDVQLRGHGRDRFLAARPRGGACQFLAADRCELHALRPRPCREYPLTVHAGRRLQVSVVLSCPGVGLEPLTSDRPARDRPDPFGLGSELGSLEERRKAARRSPIFETEHRGRRVERFLRAAGRWQDDDEVRRALDPRPPLPGPADYPVAAPPPEEEGLERLPLFFDGRAGPVALAGALGGWDLLELSATGGGRSLGRFVPPERPPGLDGGAARLLSGYLRYMLARDAFLASVHLEMLDTESGSVTDAARVALRELGATVLARAVVRSKLASRDRPVLTEAEVAGGIRATDQDWLDRPTWGDRW